MLSDKLSQAIDDHLKESQANQAGGKTAVDWAAVLAMGIKILLTILPLLTPVSPAPNPMAKTGK